MERKEDLRIQKTYDALFHAFQELLTEKSFDKITVRELCARARTRTATFYSHFSDKYDFFDFMVRRISRQYIDLSLIAAEMEPQSYVTSILRFTLDFLDEHEAFLCAVDSSSALAPTLNLISRETNAQIREHFEILASRGNTLSTDPEILAELFVGAAMQIARWWFSHRKEISREELMEKLADVLPRMIFR